MRKNFVIDTNIIIHDPNCFEKFEENNVYVPYPVIEELDGKKKDKGEAGFCAREGIRNLFGYRDEGNLINGVRTGGGGNLFLYMDEQAVLDAGSVLPKGWNPGKPDNLILVLAKKLSETSDNVILVTNDADMTLKADIMNIPVQEYRTDRLAENIQAYTGRSERHVSGKDFEKLVKTRNEIPVQALSPDDNLPEPTENEFMVVKTWGDGNSYLAKYDGKKIIKLVYKDMKPCGLTTRNSGQIFLKEALMSPHELHPLTICVGPAGTGKTLFAIGCGLEQVMDNNMYKRVLVCRSNVMMDEEIGFLPGSEQEKISPLLRGIYDNLEVLFGTPEDTKDQMTDKILELFARGYIEAQAVSYLRGRSITNTYIIIDEVQNCTPNQILSIITRAGEGSKIVLLGDPNQIDNPRLDRRNNGLVYALERMKGDPLCEIVTFDENECTRSALAKSASDKLKR